jgi:hypothetical protein
MTSDSHSLSVDEINRALTQAVDLGWLIPIEHGYCFYCHTEGMVYDIVADNAPVQPARCGHCFFEAASVIVADPELMIDILGQGDDGPT